MATDFSRKNCSQLHAYAKGGSAAAVGAGCPKSKSAYQHVANEMTVGGGCGSAIVNNYGSLTGIRTALTAADILCHAEAYGPGGARAGTPSVDTGGRVVTPEVDRRVTAAKPVLPGVVKAGISPWLLVGGLGVLVLLFGKKKR